MSQGFIKDSISDSRLRVASNWLILGVVCLALAGVAAFFVAGARTPKVSEYFENPQIFQIALVIHVTLSVQAWLMAVSAALWALYSPQKNTIPDYASIYISWLGVALILLAPMIGTPVPIMNNYIPVLDSPVFLAGIAMFVSGIILQAVLMMTSLSALTTYSTNNILQFAAFVGACLMVTVPIHWLISWQYLSQPDIELFSNVHAFYEQSFWASGHILQLAYTQMMLLIWLWLADNSSLKIPIKNSTFLSLWVLNLILGVLALGITARVEPDSALFSRLFTEHMRFAPLLPLLIIGSSMIYGLISSTDKFTKAEYNALLLSGLLFGSGGIIGFLIKGQNTVIPAHYHGSTVGVTIAMMGMAYSLSERFSWKKPSEKWMNIQLWIFGIGQILHITGLAVSGGYGANRKTPGVEDNSSHFWMGVMGAGGGLAVIGGLIFVVLMIKSIINRQATERA